MATNYKSYISENINKDYIDILLKTLYKFKATEFTL